MSEKEKILRKDDEQRTIGANESGRRLGFVEVVVAAITYFAVQTAGTVATILILDIPPEDLLTAGDTATLLLVATAAVSALVAALVANVVRVRSLAAIGLRSTTGRWLLIGAGAGLLAFLVNRVVIILYVLVSGDSFNPQQGMSDAATGGAVVIFGLLVVIGGLIVPLCEELLFRGVLFGWLRRWSFPVAALVSSVVFGFAHGLNVVLPAAVILGLLAAYVYEKSGSIWPAVLVHATNNTLVFVVARIAAEAGLLTQ